ncbi:hypothetical protein NC653_014778 [Populus alba x Populus x berolinensis]|uniref:Uncharacterized protein n=1 Tax=Populus alba x Populus x berolinensis TaxID=444605 RepID=A0AAD6W4B5_9ROSI|nr:hypothetical protein NC653_014778 [Populus alba x Populus x berolinensis]
MSFLCSCFDSSPGVKFHQACVLVAIIGYKIMIFCFVQGFACSLCFRCLATLESTDLANTQAIKLSRVLIHVYLCGYCPYGSWYLVSSRDLHVQCVI